MDIKQYQRRWPKVISPGQRRWSAYSGVLDRIIGRRDVGLARIRVAHGLRLVIWRQSGLFSGFADGLFDLVDRLVKDTHYASLFDIHVRRPPRRGERLVRGYPRVDEVKPDDQEYL